MITEVRYNNFDLHKYESFNVYESGITITYGSGHYLRYSDIKSIDKGHFGIKLNTCIGLFEISYINDDVFDREKRDSVIEFIKERIGNENK